MEVLTAAVVLVGLLGMVNLLLMVGVIRRLRKMAEQPAFEPPSDGLPLGERMPEFAATTTDGEPISHELLGGPALVAFFSPGCQPCEEMMPRFVARARGFSGQAFAVVVAGPGEDGARESETLGEVARVVIEEPLAALQQAFKVEGYPTVYVFDADAAVAGTSLDSPVLAGLSNR